MFPSQSSCTFNPFLPFTPSISVPHIPSATTSISFVGSPILQSVADFTYSSSITTTSKPTLTIFASSTDDSKENDRTFAQNSYDSLEDAVNRLLGNYHRLSAIHRANAQEKLCFSQKALVLAENNQFKCHIINLLNRLATLLVEYPQESLLKAAHMIFGVLTSSDSLTNLFKLHMSSKIYELLVMLYSTPLTSENLIYRGYVKDWNEKKMIKVEEQEKYVKPRNVKYNSAKGGVYGASSNLMDLIITKKTALCSEDDLEEESERHERSSTTSASSRTIAGENELPLTYNSFSSFPLINKVTTHAAPKDSHIGETSHVHEIYDGCFFEDLTIIFKATDKLLMHYDEATERGGLHGQYPTSWPRPTPNYNKPLNNPHNFMIPTTFNRNQNTFHQPNFNQPVFEPTLLKTPPTMPTMDRNIIPLNLFTLPQGTLLPTAPFNVFNPVKHTMPGPVQQMPPLPFVNMMAPGNPITQVAPQVSPQVIQPVDNNAKAVQMEVKGGKKQQKGLDTGSAPKNSQTQTNKNVSAVKNPNSQKPKKKQDKGGFKLWDMISVQGKLKQ